MMKSLCAAALLLIAPFARADGRLTEVETRWIAAGMPVVRYARSVELPVDIVVQPDDEPGASPIAMGIKDGRCKLVLSMRGNPGARALAGSIAPALFDAVVEAVFAHEVGHCWRYVQGEWNAAPSAFTRPVDDEPSGAGLSDARQNVAESRREEGYADLVGLAWTRRTHPAQYADVRAWLERFRADAMPGEHHDTGAWLQVAREATAFDPAESLFRQAKLLWERGARAGN